MEYLDKNGLELVWEKILEIVPTDEHIQEVISDEHINDLIDAKIGEIENGTY